LYKRYLFSIIYSALLKNGHSKKMFIVYLRVL
jgi:hypothetical protein